MHASFETFSLSRKTLNAFSKKPLKILTSAPPPKEKVKPKSETL